MILLTNSDLPTSSILLSIQLLSSIRFPSSIQLPNSDPQHIPADQDPRVLMDLRLKAIEFHTTRMNWQFNSQMPRPDIAAILTGWMLQTLEDRDRAAVLRFSHKPSCV